MTQRLVSPNEMLDAAKRIQLDGREPETNDDWVLVLNFVAFNAAAGLEREICKLFAMIYDMPLADRYVQEIADYQAASKRSKI